MQTKHSNKQSGFTLVEIMIVVAIIGLLAAIAIPNFVKARATAQKNACINNLRQIDGAKEQFGLENKKTTGAPVVAGDIFGATSYIKVTATCPTDDAAYVIGNIGTAPTCGGAGGALAAPNTHALPAP
jgi:prepilin-type N-terminal cleavage/methylation domain-containing protein